MRAAVLALAVIALSSIASAGRAESPETPAAQPAPSSEPTPGPQPAPPPPARTGIVLITIDSLRADHLGCYSGGAHATPGIDALASIGFRFTRAYATSASTVPSTASILTGLLPARHGIRSDMGGRLADGVATVAGLLKSAGWSTAAVVGTNHLDSTSGFNRGFDRFDDAIAGIRKRYINISLERRASEVGESGLLAFQALPADRPFFLWLNMHDPHYDYDPPAPPKGESPAPTPYDGEIVQVDRQVAAVVAGLRARGAQVTYIVVGSHGEGLGDHSEVGHGIYLYETTIRVPLVVLPAGPGDGTGRVADVPVSLADLAPTILDLAKVPIPEGLDGRSFAPLLGTRKALAEGAPPPGAVVAESVAKPATKQTRGGKKKSPSTPEDARRLYIEALMPREAYGWSPLFAVVQGNHKIVQGVRLEAFDLAADPGEEKPLTPPPPWTSALAAFGKPLLGTLDPPEDQRRRVMAAAEALPLPWENSPFCAEKGSWPDPRDPERVALNEKLFTGRVQMEQGLVGLSLEAGQSVLETDPANLSALDFVIFLGLRNHWGDMLFDPLEILQCNYPYQGIGYHYLGHLYDQDRKPDKALACFRLYLMAEPWNQEAEMDVAAALASAGSMNEALDHVARAVDHGFHETRDTLRNPRFRKLREDPRYLSIVPQRAKIGPSGPP